MDCKEPTKLGALYQFQGRSTLAKIRTKKLTVNAFEDNWVARTL
jgi:hypothetical protein